MGYEERADESQVVRQFGGLNLVDAELALPLGDSPALLNVDLHPNGAVKARAGYSGLGNVLGVMEYDAIFYLSQTDIGKGWLYAYSISEAKIYRAPEPGTGEWVEVQASTGVPTLVDQGVFGSAVGAYELLVSALYLARSNGPPVIATGAAAAVDLVAHPVGSPGTGAAGTGTKGYPSTWGAGHYPIFMRLLGIGKGVRMHSWGISDDPNKVYYSELDVPWNYLRRNVDDYSASAQPEVDGGYYYVNPGDGDRVVSVVDMFSYTVVFKEYSTCIFTGDPGSSDWAMAARFPVGIVGDKAWVKVGNDLHFWSNSGPKMLSAVKEYGDLAQGNPSLKISPIVAYPTPSAVDRIRCYHDEANNRVVWLAPLASTAHCDTAFVYYYYTENWTKWTGTFCEIHDLVDMRRTTSYLARVVAATAEKGIIQLQSGDSDGSLPISSYYETAWINMGSVSDTGRSLWIDVFYTEEGAGVELYYQRDLRDGWILIDRVIRSSGAPGSAIGTAIIGVDEIGSPGRGHLRFELDTLFEVVRFKFQATSTGGWGVMGYRVEVRMKGAST